MTKPLVAGNWKMHGNTEQASSLASQLAANWNDLQAVEMVVFPPFVHLSTVKEVLANSAVALGAQNISQHEGGAYTGEISGAMLVEQGCQYVLVNKSKNTESESLPVSTALSFVAGLSKELNDSRGKNGFFSVKDMIANCAGLLVAAAIINS